MAVKIRLKRIGAKKNPFYRVVVADSRFPRDGRFIEEIGTYNPLKDPAEVKIDMETAQKWIKNGAQPTDTVRALLKKGNTPVQEVKPKTKPAAKAEMVSEAEVAPEIITKEETEVTTEAASEVTAEVVPETAKKSEDSPE